MALPEDQRHFELLVITHIDRDHIEGILALLEEEELSFSVDDIWFNGWPHLPGNEAEVFGALQGERLTAAILKHQLPWNIAFNKKAVVIPDSGQLPEKTLPGGMKLTLLSPHIKHLEKLRTKWEKEVKEEGLIPGFGLLPPAAPEEGEESFGALPDVNKLNEEDFEEDDSVPNGSSIAFLASFEEKNVLFAADAYPGVLLESLNKLFPEEQVPVELVKLSHHGSSGNTSPDLIEKCKGGRYVISTSGARFHHPKAITMSRVIKRGGDNVELIFNYQSDDNEIWNTGTLKFKHRYKTRYPEDGSEGIMVKIQ